jgi:hypothetical protein
MTLSSFLSLLETLMGASRRPVASQKMQASPQGRLLVPTLFAHRVPAYHHSSPHCLFMVYQRTSTHLPQPPPKPHARAPAVA